MRLLGAAHVRNEADIVEAFVRHNLVLLDGLAIVDHASVDATPDILRALKDEGLPVFLARDESPAFDQRPMQNRLVRHLLATSDATWIFPLDADEFLRAPSRDALVNALSSVGNIPDLALEWTTYVPDFDAHDDVLACVRSARRVRDDGHGLRKVAVSRAFGADATSTCRKGSTACCRGARLQHDPRRTSPTGGRCRLRTCRSDRPANSRPRWRWDGLQTFAFPLASPMNRCTGRRRSTLFDPGDR